MFSIIRDFTWIEWLIAAAMVLCIAAVIIGDRSAAEFDNTHSCVPTGKERFQMFLHTGDVTIPIYQHEKRCEDGTVVWR